MKGGSLEHSWQRTIVAASDEWSVTKLVKASGGTNERVLTHYFPPNQKIQDFYPF
jgi:hypothetical protein